MSQVSIVMNKRKKSTAPIEANLGNNPLVSYLQ
jgi:hypothetical protein